jgi:hypothetical protein
METNRTWTAKIEIGTDVFDADLSEANLKADQMKSAVLEAGRMLRELRSSDAVVVLFKTTKSGTRQDEVRSVWLEGDKVRYL